jgi:hypothetical protein
LIEDQHKRHSGGGIVKHLDWGTLGRFHLQRVLRWLKQLPAKRYALTLLTLVATCAGPTRDLRGECSCVTCRHRAGANLFCAPQSMTTSLEATEWGVRSDFICPTHSGLFGSACQCPSQCLSGDCAADETCDGTCDATCDASRLDGLAGWDSDIPSNCDCAHGDGSIGLCRHKHFRLLGIGPRARQRLMRKTLVYPTISPEFVAIPCTSDAPHGMVQPATTELAANGGSEGTYTPLDVQPIAAHSLISRPPAPVTVLLSEMVNEPAPVVRAIYGSSSSSGRAAHGAWIGGDVETTWRSDTMESAPDFQPPAPVLPARPAASADAWPERSPSHLPHPR